MLLFAMTRNRCLNYLKHKSIVDKYTISCLARAKIGEERLYNYDFSFAENGHPYLYQELEQQIQRTVPLLHTEIQRHDIGIAAFVIQGKAADVTARHDVQQLLPVCDLPVCSSHSRPSSGIQQRPQHGALVEARVL